MPLLDWALMYACRMVSRLWHGGALSHRVSRPGDWRAAVLRCSGLLRRECAHPTVKCLLETQVKALEMRRSQAPPRPSVTSEVVICTSGG